MDWSSSKNFICFSFLWIDIYVYREKILAKDESFFIENDYTEIKQASTMESVGGIIEEVSIDQDKYPNLKKHKRNY